VVVEYIRYTVGDDTAAADLEAAYTRAASALDSSPHCQGYELTRGVEEPGNFILRIEWDSLEGHEKGFRTSPEFQEFFKEVRLFFDAIEEMRHYERTEVVGSRRTAA
jgi:hemoglobin